MILTYLDEKIANENGIECRVLDTTAIDFSEARFGRKSATTLVIRANGGEKIDTLNKDQLVESTYVANEGEAIFCNNETDIYVPRNSEGVGCRFDQIEECGYEVVSAISTEDGRKAMNIKNTKVARILPEVITEPTCIKDAWGEGSHQFLFEGATLKQDPESKKITGIDKNAFDATWEVTGISQAR